MPVNGPYQFKRAVKADPQGVIADENEIGVDEWAWVRRTIPLDTPGDEKHYLMLLIRDPDCRELATVWRRFGTDVQGHQIDGHGNIHPSILHTWKYGEEKREMCGFHSMPTKLIDFVDVR